MRLRVRKVASKGEGRSRYIAFAFFNGLTIVLFVIRAALSTSLVGLE